MVQPDDQWPRGGLWEHGTALLVIAIGVALLLSNFDIRLSWFPFHNAWALLILLGAAPSLGDALRRYRAQGRVDGAVFHDLCTAAVVATVAAIFLLDLSWSRWWPLFVIYAGLCMLAPRRCWRRQGR
ncbi:MAG: hypothetical protein EPN49_14670 [Rhodanobacter sp.]|nr:MAG: hypothetical protein EPN49_14670 [Rhodanobacter sp.]